MRLSHINITMPKGCEGVARTFYAGLLGLKEIPKPESIRNRGGVWFEAGGLNVHVSTSSHGGSRRARRDGTRPGACQSKPTTHRFHEISP